MLELAAGHWQWLVLTLPRVPTDRRNEMNHDLVFHHQINQVKQHYPSGGADSC